MSVKTIIGLALILAIVYYVWTGGGSLIAALASAWKSAARDFNTPLSPGPDAYLPDGSQNPAFDWSALPYAKPQTQSEALRDAAITGQLPPGATAQQLYDCQTTGNC